MRWYGVDLLDWGTPWLSSRRLVNLLEHLPRESLYVQEQAGEAARWGDTEHLLADVIDVLQASMWQFATANSKKRPKRPRPIRRPGVEPVGEKRIGTARMTVDEARAYLDRFREPAEGG